MLTPFRGGALSRHFCVLTYDKSVASCLTCSIGSLAHHGLASKAALRQLRTVNRER
jgi:citrate synthase